jgi:hypothetical protein
MTTYTLTLRNNATGESVVSFTVSEQMYRYGDLGRVLNDCVAAIQRGQCLDQKDTPSAGFSEASASSGEEGE